MTKRTITTVLVVAIMTVSGLALAQAPNPMPKNAIDISLVPEAVRGQLGLSDEQVAEIVSIRRGYEKLWKDNHARALRFKNMQQNLERRGDLSIEEKASYENKIKGIHSETLAARTRTTWAMFNQMNDGQKQRMAELCARDDFELRPGVPTYCRVPFNKLYRPRARAEQARAEREQAQAEQARVERVKAHTEAEQARVQRERIQNARELSRAERRKAQQERRARAHQERQARAEAERMARAEAERHAREQAELERVRAEEAKKKNWHEKPRVNEPRRPRQPQNHPGPAGPKHRRGFKIKLVLGHHR